MLIVDEPPATLLAVTAGGALVETLVVDVNRVEGVAVMLVSDCCPPTPAPAAQSPSNQVCNASKSTGEQSGHTATGFEGRVVRKADWQKHDW